MFFIIKGMRVCGVFYSQVNKEMYEKGAFKWRNTLEFWSFYEAKKAAADK